MKGFSLFAILLAYIAVADGSRENIASSFSLGSICDDTDYGTVLSTSTANEGAVRCAMRCQLYAQCLSFTFDPVTKACKLNSLFYVNGPPSSCTGNTIHYGFLPTPSCTAPINNVRLCEGGGPGIFHPSKGRVELFRLGQWITVCDDYWDDQHHGTQNGVANANVLCTSIGFASGESRPNSFFTAGPSSMVIWMDFIKCVGTELTIFDCDAPLTSNSCTHVEDVGVECT